LVLLDQGFMIVDLRFSNAAGAEMK